MTVIVFKICGLARNIVQGLPTLPAHVGYKNLTNRAACCSLQRHLGPKVLSGPESGHFTEDSIT